MDKTDERKLVDQLALGVLSGADFAERSNTYWSWILGLTNNEVWRARHDGYVSPPLLLAMAAKGYLDQSEVVAVLKVQVTPCGECGEAHTQKTCAYSRKRQRTRFNADVSPELKAEITAEARRVGWTNGLFLGYMFARYKLLPREHRLLSDGEIRRLADAAGEVE